MTPSGQTTQFTQRQARAALVKAIKAQDMSAIDHLITTYPSVLNAKNAHHNTPLSEAIGTGNLAMVQLMVDAGADPTNINHGGSGLVGGALYGGYHDIAHYLIEQGAPVTFAELAACQTPAQLSDYLDQHPKAMEDSAISARRMTPLHLAALAGHLPGVDWLLSHGMDPESPDRHGHTALATTPECQLAEKRCAIASRLLAAGANPNVPGGHHGGTVLDRAIIAGDRDLSALLLDAGANPDHQDWSGKTALHHAVNRNAELTRLVLSHQPVTSTMAKNGETAVAMARRLNKHAVIRCFETVT
ncbi:MAG: ankyrin repeat domain-containing protein [Pseudomonadota bacterium]